MTIPIRALLISWLLSLPIVASANENMDRLTTALALPEIIDVMRIEGMNYGEQLAQDMFPNRIGDRWNAMLDSIYDTGNMSEIALAGFSENLTEDQIGALTTFFESDLGVELIKLEISARYALMDDEIDDANQEHVANLIAENDPRIALLKQFIQVNNLLETNVVGALNSNFAFYSGLVEGGAYPEPVTEDKILQDVWQQEPELRQNTEEWLYGFLSMAYAPVSDTDLRAYIEFSQTPAGQALNTALFAGFDQMFESISRDLGMAAAQMMSGEDL